MNPSPHRQKLRLLADEIPHLVSVALARSPLWRGNVHDARRSCGKPNCRCATGELHVSTQLADRSGKKLRNLALKGPLLGLFQRMTEDYRSVRQARARFVRVTREMLSLMDQLEEIRREEAVRRHGGKLPSPRPPP
jgi:hypothetical protein